MSKKLRHGFRMTDVYKRQAQVLFEEGEKRVSLNESQTMLGVLETPAVKTLYYFFGTMTEIYGDV